MGWFGDAIGAVGDFVADPFDPGGNKTGKGSTVTVNNPDGTPGTTPAFGAAAPPSTAWSAPQPGPYSTGGGVQGGQSQSQMQGLDFTQRGPAEQAWIDNSAAYSSPAFAEVNNQGLVGMYSDPNNRPQVTNNQQAIYDQFNNSGPTDLGPYFENAKRRAAESIAQSTAARGSYGSSSANDQTARAFTDLEGQRALKEADYGLQRFQTGGNLAGGADSQSGAMSQDEQGWAELLGRLGMDASQLGLDRTNSLMDASGLAGRAGRDRGQDYFNNTAASGDRFSDQMLRVMLQGLGIDADLFQTGAASPVAEGNAALGHETANAATAADAAQTGLSIYDKYTS